eukprot:gnl/TRDRNA2_/TRDRNA2_128461_c0_seq2.p1 gnl/TRDRNA2_/TRDRNA2_128461_c0~~gnl/TRDRNA2_/TRDRNA2_128461_c0_seq2.p1  ORF type:complete len:202 (-),score=0.80 gnl/TRDRNA2_/TRDRNA2_128461_c0_seq2:104-709(-)
MTLEDFLGDTTVPSPSAPSLLRRGFTSLGHLFSDPGSPSTANQVDSGSCKSEACASSTVIDARNGSPAVAQAVSTPVAASSWSGSPGVRVVTPVTSPAIISPASAIGTPGSCSVPYPSGSRSPPVGTGARGSSSVPPPSWSQPYSPERAPAGSQKQMLSASTSNASEASKREPGVNGHNGHSHHHRADRHVLLAKTKSNIQ